MWSNLVQISPCGELRFEMSKHTSGSEDQNRGTVVQTVAIAWPSTLSGSHGSHRGSPKCWLVTKSQNRDSIYRRIQCTTNIYQITKLNAI